MLAGYPVVRLKATLFDGSYHPVDSSEQAFKMAAHIAYKNGLSQASPCLLEPIELLKITVPDDNTGDIMGIVNKRRGAVLGMNPVGDGMTEVDAELPMAETGDLATVVRQMTKGMGWFTMEFARYEQLPENLKDVKSLQLICVLGDTRSVVYKATGRDLEKLKKEYEYNLRPAPIGHAGCHSNSYDRLFRYRNPVPHRLRYHPQSP